MDIASKSYPGSRGSTEAQPQSGEHREALREGDTVIARVFRFDPSRDSQPHYETYKVPYSRKMRILDVLNFIAEDLEEDLAYRWFCGVKKCGTCAVRMNGREVLACWDPVEPVMQIEPLRHFSVVRDLVVDRTPYEELVFSFSPWLQRQEAYPGFPERLSHREMGGVAHALDCLSCLACYSACPVLDLGDTTRFSGPAPLVQLGQTALDPRDAMDRGRIALEQADVFSCVSCYKCEEACPAGIPIVSEIIEPLKAKAYRSCPDKSEHSRAFADIVEERGRIDPSKLVLRAQGLRALSRLDRVLRLLLRGKINPVRTFFGGPIAGIAEVRKLFQETRDHTP